jgi:hypothetical protein
LIWSCKMGISRGVRFFDEKDEAFK